MPPCSACWRARNSCSAARSRPSRRSSPPIARSADAIGVSSGTSALHLALLAAGVGRGDEVITTPHHVHRHGVGDRLLPARTPVFVDIDPATFTIDPAKIEAAITPRTKAILPVHLYGQHGRHGPDPGDRRAPRSAGDRGRRAGARRRVQGPPRRQHRRSRLLQLLPRQEPGRLRRRRRGDNERPGARPAGPHAARLGRRAALPPRPQGLQLPARRRPGRGAAA